MGNQEMLAELLATVPLVVREYADLYAKWRAAEAKLAALLETKGAD